ncbi:MraY family glycosyltransferase [Caldinitratiruptor microaerophilus]|uniref:Undecaprenyl-phosphate alpha-N-acetylglucosaminyl 1-phosphate transferase n=1 Tax=Caldinitratiruptor microaerophilus TaxID=671077 RepID=A0AA35G9S0_9FIRM|nr:MraY family glycosyltransferase [Caldinitratiruptor microaerophilus]BDG61773.1 undecaprenyl-phosphate alpha-N-acetylglucosaminyl 1-phosphate transferase [Caldinitratiruptor microaerophilus]
MHGGLLGFLLATVLALVLTPLARKLALRTGCLDPVVSRSVHREPTPYLGGLAIFAAFVLAVLAVARPLDRGELGILVGGSLAFAVGLVDDLRRRAGGLSARVKFLLQIAAAAVTVVGFDLRIDWIQNFFTSRPGDYIFFGWLAVPLTVLWLVSFTNVINLADGLDGLAAGISTIGALTLVAVALGQGQREATLLAAALAGAAVGFLRYNFNPARIFMGDAGAMFLGFTLGAVAVYGVLKSALAVGVLVPIVALGLPIADTALAILRRVLGHRPVGEPDRDHLHHRLLRLGLSQRAAVLLLWTVSGALALTAVTASELAQDRALAVMAAVSLGLLYGGARTGLLTLGGGTHRSAGGEGRREAGR